MIPNRIKPRERDELVQRLREVPIGQVFRESRERGTNRSFNTLAKLAAIAEGEK